MPRTCWDSRDPTIPANWIVWQKPLRFFDGPYYSGFTRWVSPEVTPPRPIDVWWANAAVVDHGGTITHHHAVGRFHRPWYDRQRPEPFAMALRAAKRELDPNAVLNPGVLFDP